MDEFGVKIAANMRDAQDQDFGVGRLVDDHLLPNAKRADFLPEIGSSRSQVRELYEISKRLEEPLPIRAPLRRSSLSLGIREKASEISLCVLS